MQLCPISGRFIFLDPRSSQFELTSEMDPLWRKFECINLEINHRQGEDKAYANMLNRVRIGEETPDDIEQLKSKVRKKGHHDITKEKDALYIFGTNKNVNKMNDNRLDKVSGEEHTIHAITIHKTIKIFNPPVGGAGEVMKTPFQKELKLKIHAKVMLTYNVDTRARGELVGIIKEATGNISKLIVKFDRDSVGREKRNNNQDLLQKYPGGTPIEKVNFPFSISKSKKTVISTAAVIQFPLKLAFACTAHKVQGSTIPKPNKVIINTKDTFAAAMIYVMLSRVCSMTQILILNEFNEGKMYPSQRALQELRRFFALSLNNNPSNWEKEDKEAIKICSLNCRSLKKHHQDILSDDLMLKSNIICLNETWLEDHDTLDNFGIPQYQLITNNRGKGKGIAAYLKSEIFQHTVNITEDNMQLSKFTSSTLDIISIYRSQKGNFNDLNSHINTIQSKDKPLLLIGDFNFCYRDQKSNPSKKYFAKQDFIQLIDEPTHIEGHLLDQAYVRDKKKMLNWTVDVQSKYYSDHKALAIVVKKSKEN